MRSKILAYFNKLHKVSQIKYKVIDEQFMAGEFMRALESKKKKKKTNETEVVIHPMLNKDNGKQ